MKYAVSRFKVKPLNKISMKKLKLLLLLAIVSCTDPIETTEIGYDFSSANILTFNDESGIIGYGKQSNGNASFVSIDDLYRKAIIKLGESQTEEEHSKILEEYKDVLVLKDSTYVPLLGNVTYRKIINRDRLYVSANYVHKVIDDQYIIFTEKENVNTLLKLESPKGINEDIFRVVKYQDSFKTEINEGSIQSGRTNANCGSNLIADYFDNHGGCSDDRRAYVRAYSYFIISGYYYTPAVFSECWAEIRNWRCNWNQYTNVLHSKNTSFTVSMNINNSTLSYNSGYIPDYSGTGYEWEHVIWGTTSGGSPVGPSTYWNNGPSPTIQFSAIHMESSSQGVGANIPGHWAVIHCQ